MPAAVNMPLERIIDLIAACLTPDAARRLATLRVDGETQARISELAEKANEGRLTADEESQYRQIVEALDFVAILQARARELLATRTV